MHSKYSAHDKGKSDYKKSDRKSKQRSRSRDRSREDAKMKNIPKESHNEGKYKKDEDSKRKGRWSDAPNTEKALSATQANTNNLWDDNRKLFQSGLIDIVSPINPMSTRTNQMNTLKQFSSTSLCNNNNQLNLLMTLNDSSKVKKKIYIPKLQGVNFVGLLIGPKGTYQKRLESQTNCKILIRGKGTQKDSQTPYADDEDEQHVLVVGDTEESAEKAELLVKRVLYSDPDTRNKIREEQLKVSQEIRSEQFYGGDPATQIEDHLMTPYGPPDKSARIVQVPNDCVGLIIGKNGETIRRLHREAGCKIQIAKKEIPNTESRNVFIEGTPEKYEIAKKLIEDIVAEQQKLKSILSQLSENNPYPGPYTCHQIANKFIGLIVGKHCETVRNLHQETGCYIFIPKEKTGDEYRTLELSGSPESIQNCIRKIEQMIKAADNQMMEGGDVNYEAQQQLPVINFNLGVNPNLKPNQASQSKININLINTNNYNYSSINNFNNFNEMPFTYYSTTGLNTGKQYGYNNLHHPAYVTNPNIVFANNMYFPMIPAFEQPLMNNPTNIPQLPAKINPATEKEKTKPSESESGNKNNSILSYIYGGQLK